ncbi:amino acid adenylation domain-containing protein [Crossiella sp. CA198]|uniref:non-ribosomal peptide synthetase n=1 Tax=Crossiella sp. CA198 TaxID=3455607 RepID=UPI003F8D090A
MTAPEIISELQALGVELWTVQGRIRFRAAPGLLTEDHRARLRAHRDEVLDLLSAEAQAGSVVADPRSRHEPFPLTDVQTAYLLGRQESFEYGGVACHGYLEVRYPLLDPVRFERVWNQLITRHDMLRAIILADGYQQVLSSVDHYRVPVTDLRGRDADPHLAAVREELGHHRHDTTAWPLFELRLTRTDAGDVLHISLDSLIADWGSATVLLDEIDALMLGDELPPLELTFRDYLLAERGLRQTSRYQRDQEYWQARVDELPLAPDLPVGPAPQGPGRFERHRFRLPAAQWDRLREQARVREITPANAVLTAYAAVLERWSARSRFSLNLTLLGRLPLHPQTDRLVGDFTSVSLLAVEPRDRRGFTDWAGEIGARLFADLEHRLFTGVEVLRELTRRRGRAAALMPVVFTSGIGVGPADSTGSGRTLGEGITQTPQVLLDCQANDGDGELVVDWDVRAGVFPAGLVEDMFAAFSALLTDLAVDAEAWTSGRDLPLPAWQQRERAEVNNTAGPLPDARLHAEVFAQAGRTPEAIAVRTPAGTLTYDELIRRAAAVAEAVRCTGADRVAVVLDKGADQVVAVLGVLLAGAAYVPVDTSQPRLRRDRMLADAGVRQVLTQSWLDTEWPAEVHRTNVDALTPAESRPEVPAGDPDALAYLIYTSGSTGTPKGVLMTHRAALNTVRDINERYRVDAADRVLGLAQLGFDLSVYDLFGPLAVGATLVLPDPARRADPSHWAELVADHGVTLWNSVPAQLQMLANYLESSPTELLTLRLALLSGDWIPVTLPAQIARFAPALRPVSLGGATEAAIWSIHHDITEADPDLPSIPYGTPLRNQGFRVLDQQYRDCPVWTVGELHITGDGLALGYNGDPELSAAKFFPHPADGQRLYRTGDLGRYRPGGEIEFLGRRDNQVKLRGHRVELGEVEAGLLAHPGVGAAAAVLAGDTAADRVLLAFAEPAHTAPAEQDDQRLRTAVHRFADRQVGELTAETVAGHVHALHRAALLSMLAALTGAGLFAEGGHTRAEVLAAAGVADQHVWLVRRWLELLREHGLLALDGDRYYAVDITEDVDAAWHRVRAGVEAGLWTAEFLDYHLDHLHRLPELLAGTQSPFELLFPAGDTARALAVYRDYSITRYLNHGAAAVLRRIAAAHPTGRSVRVLEVGAGTGATTSVVLPLLAGYEVDYQFTDLTPFFLGAARAQFPTARLALFDLDGELRAQGQQPSSVDVLLCAGVLSSTKDVRAALRRAVELLAPGGYLVLTEPTAELPHLLLTQGFMMLPTPDGTTPVHDLTRWRALLAEVGAEEVLCLPEQDHPFAAHGMHLLTARVKTDRSPVTAPELLAHLAERVPAHMVPGQLQLVDALPVTANGKIDRGALANWRIQAVADDGSDNADTPADELEAAVTALWAEALGVTRLGREDNLYERGADSLIMARVAGKLREQLPEAAALPYDTLLRAQLNEPRIAALLHLLRASTSPAELPAEAARPGSGNALLVPFGGGVDGPVRVLFHAALGTMDYFQHLGKALAAQGLGPVVGIAVADTEVYCATAPRDLVAAVADGYAQRLAEEGHTRFQLIGYCLGGLFAVEVARRLLERGLDVANLTLVDSIPMMLDTDEELAFESIFVPNLDLDPVAAVFGPEVDADDLGRAVSMLMARNGNRIEAGELAELTGDPGLDAVAAAARARAAVPQQERLAGYAAACAEGAGIPVAPELIPALFRVTRHSVIAARFDPEPYAGDLTFLRAEQAQSFGITAGVGHLAEPFWANTCLDEFTVHGVPGNHFSLIEPPHVGEVAEHLATALRVHPDTDQEIPA